MVGSSKQVERDDMENKLHPIIFFDGVCHVCNYTVDFILKRDEGIFLFAPLQGQVAAKKLDTLPDYGQLKSIVLLDEEGIHLKSQAVLKILSRLRVPWKWAKYLKVIPLDMRDGFYDYFAAHRYQWFGKRDSCRLPTQEERLRFLD
jgi:predicted DCC family thiol-disulfide oxidoreductase YuxK